MSRTFALALTALSLVGLHSHAQEPEVVARPVVVDGPTMLIAVSTSGKTLYGYSSSTGESEGVAVAITPWLPFLILGLALAYWSARRSIRRLPAIPEPGNR